MYDISDFLHLEPVKCRLQFIIMPWASNRSTCGSPMCLCSTNQSRNSSKCWPLFILSVGLWFFWGGIFWGKHGTEAGPCDGCKCCQWSTWQNNGSCWSSTNANEVRQCYSIFSIWKLVEQKSFFKTISLWGLWDSLCCISRSVVLLVSCPFYIWCSFYCQIYYCSHRRIVGNAVSNKSCTSHLLNMLKFCTTSSYQEIWILCRASSFTTFSTRRCWWWGIWQQQKCESNEASRGRCKKTQEKSEWQPNRYCCFVYHYSIDYLLSGCMVADTQVQGSKWHSSRICT